MPQLSTILGRFETAPAGLIASRSLLRRIDSKFLVSESAAVAVLDVVTADYKIMLAGTERIATYRTVYYDTPSLRCFHDHRRGRRPRQKVRIRHYDDRRVSFLEVKTRRSSMISFKARRPQDFDNPALSQDGRNFVTENSRLDSAKLERSVSTDFSRITLVSDQTNERITIDLNMTMALNGSSENLTGAAIIEVKQSPFSTRTPVMETLRKHGLRPSSASKYCTASALLRPNLPINRFLPALRVLKALRR